MFSADALVTGLLSMGDWYNNAKFQLLTYVETTE